MSSAKPPKPTSDKTVTPSPPATRRPPSPQRRVTKERASTASSPSSSPSLSSLNPSTSSTSITSSSSTSSSKLKAKRSSSSSSLLSPAPISASNSTSFSSTSNNHSPIKNSREKSLPSLSPVSSTSTVSSTATKERKEEVGEGTSNKSFRKRLPPRLNLGDEKDDSYSIRFSPDNQFVVAGGGDGGIKVYNTSNGKLTFHLTSTDNLPVTCLRFRPNTQYVTTKNILLSASAGGAVKHWHVTTGKCVHTINEADNQVYAVDFRQDAERFATAGKDYKVRIYDESKRTLSATLSGGHGDVTAGHASRVFSLKFHPTQPDLVISGGWDNTIQIWDTRVAYSVRSIFGPHICGDAVDIYGDTILSGSWRPDKAVQTWDFGTGKLLDTFDWRPAMGEEPCLVYAAQFSKGNGAEYVAAGGSGSNEAKIFNHRTKQVVAEVFGFRKGIYTLDFSADSKMFVVGGSGILQLFELHLNE